MKIAYSANSLFKLAIKHGFWLKLVAVITLASSVSACSEQAVGQPDDSPYIHAATISPISQQASYSVTREYIGEIAAKQQTKLSFEFGGRVLSVVKDSGDAVKAGELLASLDVELLNIRAYELKAQIAQVEAQLSLNQANLARTKSLIKKQYASAQTIDELEAQFGVLTANKDALVAAYDALSYQIAKAELRAPYNGVINERIASQGELVNPGTPAFTLIKQSQQEITLGVPAKVAETLTLGAQLPVTIAEQTHTATIKAIGQQINPATRTVNIRLGVDGDQRNISGLIARVAIAQDIQKPGYWLPLTALTDGIRGQWNIYAAVAQDNHYVIKPFTVNVLHTTDTMAFIAGLTSPEMEIISEGLHRYVPGQLVRAAGAGQ
ncbi:efflux RND transporter periplasmic adaptor subunit [Thalassotalea euphylliae]|uniref:Efflux RND transporter periplasmic adaptor subunit n=1 Tax=Thalassotalea euphylliae TaxID=1655234 RepID=A0A3E0TV37_9GAMM|nr:efflux RND transporter periplasmic adaptor subunit [Thalassotalea euphylliae]REL28237.1 efflux RND transporter periplasmic adaptor subunit [Thalassotalea euphylliae]